jgi:hypothetical protein
MKDLRYILANRLTGEYYQLPLGSNDYKCWTRTPEDAFTFYNHNEIYKVMKENEEEFLAAPFYEIITVMAK